MAPPIYRFAKCRPPPPPTAVRSPFGHADDRLVVVHQADRMEPGDRDELRDDGEPVGREAGHGAREAEADEAAERGEGPVALAEGAGGVEHDVDAAPTGQPLHLLLEVA